METQQFGKEVSISLQSENDIELKKSVEWLKENISSINMVKEVIDNGGVGNRELHLKLKEKSLFSWINRNRYSKTN